ncbi:MAG: hypothetical protein V1650_04355 [Candidatus Omnitrophota bacterium]
MGPFNKFSSKEKLGLAIAAIFILVVFLDRAIIGPINNRVKEINREIHLSEKQLERYVRQVRHKGLISQEYAKYKQQIKKVGTDEEETVRILAEIEALASKLGVRLVNVKPRPCLQIELGKEYSVEVEAEADMGALANFFYQLNASEQLLRIEKLSLVSKDKNSSALKSLILVTKIVID